MAERTVMIYGESGDTKTTQLYHLAKYIIRKTGKKIRLIHGDLGGYAPFLDSGMIQRGEVELFDYKYRELALADFVRCSRGYWPRRLTSGELYFKTDNNCETTIEKWKEIGAYFIEGMASIGESLKNHCSNQETGVGFKDSWRYTEDDYTVAGLQPGHYGLVQKEMYARVTRFASLPCEWIVWTSLVGKGEEKMNQDSKYGPQLVGNASTPSIPNWFMDCLHLSTETVLIKRAGSNEPVKEDRKVAWFRKHRSKYTDIEFLAKARCLPELYPKLLEKYPYGFVPLGYDKGIEKYFETLEELNLASGNYKVDIERGK